MGYTANMIVQCVAMCLSAGTVAVIIILHFVPLPIPSIYSLKITQSITNALVTLVAAALTALYHYSFGLAHAAQVQAELQAEKLSILRIRMHYRAENQAIWKLFKLVRGHKAVRVATLGYLFILFFFSLVAFPFTTIVALEDQRYPATSIVDLNVVLGSDVPGDADSCGRDILGTNCTYDIALGALHAQVVTCAPYTIAGVTITPPLSTRGLTWHIFEQFAEKAAKSTSGDERTRYCLPVLNEKSVSCVEDTTGTRALYDEKTVIDTPTVDLGVDLITINPNSSQPVPYARININNGTMVVSESKLPDENMTTIVTATDSHADTLSQLTYGTKSKMRQFTLVCNISTEHTWQWVDFEFMHGTMSFAVSDDSCAEVPNTGAFAYLGYALEGTTSISAMVDGYSKLINPDVLSSVASLSYSSQPTRNAFQDYAHANNMTMLESLLSQMHEIVQTSYTASTAEIVHTTVIQTLPDYHTYIISVPITIPVFFALLVAVAVCSAIFVQAFVWYTASRSTSQLDLPQLLDPVELMAYTTSRALENDEAREFLRDSKEMLRNMDGKNAPRLGYDRLTQLTPPVAVDGVGLNSNSNSPHLSQDSEKNTASVVLSENSTPDGTPKL